MNRGGGHLDWGTTRLPVAIPTPATIRTKAPSSTRPRGATFGVNGMGMSPRFVRKEVMTVADRSLLTPFLSMEHDMQTLFDRLWGRETAGLPMRPRMDVFRDGGAIKVTMELPGIDPEKDVDISVQDDILVVKGEKTREYEVDEQDRYLFERTYGAFERRIPLPDGADTDHIEASYDKGVLTITVPMPVTEEASVKKIPVTTS